MHIDSRMNSDSLPEVQFKNQLTVMHSTDKKTVLMTKDEYFSLIEELKEAIKVQTAKSNRQYYILKRHVN